MKIRKTEIEKACAVRDIRSYLNAPYVNAETSMMYASDGHIMARVPVTLEDGDESGFIPPKALQAARKIDRQADAATLKANGHIELPNGETMPRPDVDPMPAEMCSRMDGMIAGESFVDVWLDADLLARLADAICSGKHRGVGLSFPRAADGSIIQSGAIHVRPCAEAGTPAAAPRGLLMPMRDPK